MSDLSDFLLAQIAEDEAECRREIADGYGGDQHESGWSSNRVLAECDAKRRIVAAHPMGEGQDGGWEIHRVVGCLTCITCGVDGADIVDAGPCPTLRALALPYASHPDYRDEWRP